VKDTKAAAQVDEPVVVRLSCLDAWRCTEVDFQPHEAFGETTINDHFQPAIPDMGESQS
jgi:hypothetical protein